MYTQQILEYIDVAENGLRKIEPRISTYEEAEKLVAAEYKMVFGSTKSLINTVNGIDVEFDRYNYETYLKEENSNQPIVGAEESNNL